MAGRDEEFAEMLEDFRAGHPQASSGSYVNQTTVNQTTVN